MPKKDKFEHYVDLPQIKIKVKDVFSLGDLITAVNEYLKEMEYTDYNGAEDQEILYSHKLISGGSMVDIWMLWRMLKYPEGTSEDTAYLRYLLNIDIHFMGDVQEVEVMHKGKKAKLNKGEIEFVITPCIEIDFNHKWEESKFLNMVKEVFRKKIYKEEIDAHQETLYGEAVSLQDFIKQFFRIETLAPEETTHVGPKGLI